MQPGWLRANTYDTLVVLRSGRIGSDGTSGGQSMRVVRRPRSRDIHRHGNTNASHATALRDVPWRRFGIGPADGRKTRPHKSPKSVRSFQPRMSRRCHAFVPKEAHPHPRTRSPRLQSHPAASRL